MFPNQLPGFLPTFGAPSFTPGLLPQIGEAQQPKPSVLPPVQIADIYQAAKNRAVEEHEIDKLFNADYYDDYTI
jgi:hypothetical protein